MKALFTLSLLFVLSATYAQNTTHVVTINLTDSLSGDPADVETAYVIPDGSRDFMTFGQSAVGVFAIQLEAGKYTINFKHTDGRLASIKIDLNDDMVKNVVFSPASND